MADIEPGMQTLTLIDEMKDRLGDGAYLALMNALRDDREHWQRATSSSSTSRPATSPAFVHAGPDLWGAEFERAFEGFDERFADFDRRFEGFNQRFAGMA